MKVIEKAITPCGVKIQIEDWKEKYSFIKTLNIACYPVATMSQNQPFGLEKGKTFRLNISKFSSDEEVKEIFKKLKTGNLLITDLSAKFEPINGIDDIVQYLI